MKKEDLIKVIAKELYNSEEACGEINAIPTENNYEDVAERLVNKLGLIDDINKQRNQLIAFLMNIEECYGMYERDKAERRVDEYLSDFLI